ncbi:15385_t:CDS:2, partial [Racocetra persica]
DGNTLITDYIENWMKLTVLKESNSSYRLLSRAGLQLKHIVALYELVEEHVADVVATCIHHKYKAKLEDSLKREISKAIGFETSKQEQANDVKSCIPAGVFAIALKRFIVRYLTTSENINESVNLADYMVEDEGLECWPDWADKNVIKNKFPLSLLVSHTFETYQYTKIIIEKTRVKKPEPIKDNDKYYLHTYELLMQNRDFYHPTLNYYQEKAPWNKEHEKNEPETNGYSIFKSAVAHFIQEQTTDAKIIEQVCSQLWHNTILQVKANYEALYKQIKKNSEHIQLHKEFQNWGFVNNDSMHSTKGSSFLCKRGIEVEYAEKQIIDIVANHFKLRPRGVTNTILQPKEEEESIMRQLLSSSSGLSNIGSCKSHLILARFVKRHLKNNQGRGINQANLLAAIREVFRDNKPLESICVKAAEELKARI